MSCWRIQIITDTGIGAPIEDTDGQVYLDLPDDFDLSLSEVITELNDVNELKTSSVIPFDIPKTSRNSLLCERVISPLSSNATIDPYEVIASNGEIFLNESYLHIVGENQNGFQCELRLGQNHWAYQLSQVYLNTLDFGSTDLTPVNITTRISGDYMYADGSDGFTFPFVDYGRLYTTYKPRPADFRPWIHALAVLQRSFCAIGWKFRSPFFESDIGRRLITYILRPDYGSSTRLPEHRRFLAAGEIKSTDIIGVDNIWTPLPIPEVYDNSNKYEPITGVYTNDQGVYKFFVNARLHGINTDTSTDVLVYVNIMKEDVDGNQIVLAGSGPLFFGRDTADYQNERRYRINLETDKIPVDITDKIYVDIIAGGRVLNGVPLFTWEIYTNFWNEPFEFEPQTEIVPGLEIDPSYTGMEFFKGCVHLIKGKIHTDYKSRTVWVFPTFDSTWFNNTTFQGYFQDTDEHDPIDVTDKVICNSEQITIPNNKITRYYRIQFAKSTDAYIKSLEEFPPDYPIYSKTYDLGSAYLNETTILDNPFFEPTKNREITIDQSSFNENYVQYDVPVLWDNENGELSFNIRPRICIMHAPTLGFAKKLPDGTLRKCWLPIDDQRFSYFESYGYASQVPTYTRVDGTPINEYLIYGSDEYDLGSIFWFKALNDFKNNINLSLLIMLKSSDFQQYEFRKLFKIKYKESTVFARLIEKTDFRSCGFLPTPLVFMPELNNVEFCVPEDEIETQVPACENFPELIVTQNGNCYDFTYGGIFEFDPDTVTFEYRYFDVDTWTEGSQICDPDRPFYVRATFVYPPFIEIFRICEEQILISYVEPCDNNPEFSVEYNADADELTVSIVGEILSTIDEATTEIRYTIDGGVQQTANGSSVVIDTTGAMTICYEATVRYTDACPDDEVDEECFEIQDTSCDDLDATLTCNYEFADNGGLVVLDKTGTVPFSTVLDQIRYRPIGGTEDDWRLWDGFTPLMCPFEAQRVIIFCENMCDPYCGPIVTCGCECEEFQTGTPILLSVCN